MKLKDKIKILKNVWIKKESLPKLAVSRYNNEISLHYGDRLKDQVWLREDKFIYDAF